LQVDKCDAEVRLTVDADGQQACKPTQNVQEALAKLDGLLQSWRAAVQDTQVHVTHFLPKLQQVAHLKALEKKRKEKSTPFGVNLLRSPVLYRAAQSLKPLHIANVDWHS